VRSGLCLSRAYSVLKERDYDKTKGSKICCDSGDGVQDLLLDLMDPQG